MPRRLTTTKPRNPHLLRGEIAQWRRPEWKPIMELVGDLTTWFMWMGEIELEDGTSVHAYKHRATRRYVHLAVDGRAYDYVAPREITSDDPDFYRPTTRTEALEEAFFRWEDLHLVAGERDAIAAGLELARHVAATDGRIAFDTEALGRQRRYDLASGAARRDEVEQDPGFADLRLTDDGNDFFGDLPEVVEGLIELREECAQRKAA